MPHVVGFDFDGTLACWPRGVQPQYDDAAAAFARSAALPLSIQYARSLLAQGHELVILTGRDDRHANLLGDWTELFLGRRLAVVTRPREVGLSCQAQARWKKRVLAELQVEAYVGDNPQIDAVAARAAGVRFIDVTRIPRRHGPA